MEGFLTHPHPWRGLAWLQSSTCLSCVESYGSPITSLPGHGLLDLLLCCLAGSGVDGALGQRETWAKGRLPALTASTSSPFLDQEKLPEDSAGD